MAQSEPLRIEDYSESELAGARQRSPALQRYLEIIQKNATTDSARLRCARHEAWARATLATLTKKSSAEDVCRFWSSAADTVAAEAWRLSGCAERGLAVFALGKWGSRELNLSSDVDVIFVSRAAPDAIDIKCVRTFINLLSETTEFGFCFRVDTDLKPGGRLAPLVGSLKQFEDYYWSSGQTWERLALVRLRAIAGDSELIKNLFEIVEKFVFRRFIDFTLLEDLRNLRSQIHTHYPQNEDTRRNLKLAPGGIRDIELFIHALQVIHGGKTKTLRTTSTSLAAAQLIEEKRFDVADLKYLIQSYWRFRELENTVQAFEDHQTHDWNISFGRAELDEFNVTAAKVGSIVEAVLGKPNRKPTLPSDEKERREWLTQLGFNSYTVETRVPELLSLTALSTKTVHDEELRLRVIREFLEGLASVALDKDLGVGLLIDFFRSTRAKAGFFSLLAHEDRMVRELCLLFGCSPYLGGVVAARPEVLDSFLFRTQAKPSDNFEVLLDELADQRLLTEIIAANHFLKTKDIRAFCASLSTGADAICTQLLQAVKQQTGAVQLRILALGKWGGRELGARSDLDFIFVTADVPSEADQKAAKRFLSRVTEAHKGGAIYPVDMRLRPSGKGGLLLVSEAALLDYLHAQAEPWERQSYLRARDVSGDGNFESLVHGACLSRGVSTEDLEKLRQIRSKLVVQDTDEADIKMSCGGLMDLEFAAQIALLELSQNATSSTNTLEMIAHLASQNEKWKKAALTLIRNYDFLRLVEQLFQLLNLHSVTKLSEQDAAFQRVARILELAPEELLSRVTETLRQNVAVLKDVDPRELAQ